MLPIKKQIFTDKAMRPVGVFVDYEDWQTIEKLLENCQWPVKEELDLTKYAGVIKLEKDPLEYQREIRDEW